MRSVTLAAVVLALVFGAFPAGAAKTAPCLFPTIRGTHRNDFLIGTHGRDVIRGFRGNDIILGLSGIDILCGNRGDDELDGGDGTDFVYGGPHTDRCSSRDYWTACERGGA